MKAVNYLVKENGSQTNDVNSFIGGKPKLPTNIEVPKCKVCGKDLTFLFQIAFPKGHSWDGKSMAVFTCIYADRQHDIIPRMVNSDGYDENLNKKLFNIKSEHIDNYEDFFRFIIFDTEKGELVTNFEETVVYKEFDIKHTKKDKSKEDFVVSGKPIWIMGMDETPQSICGDNEVQLLLQVKEDYLFDKLETAPEQAISLKRRRIKGYDLFIANRIYFWGNSDINNPRVYISVQRP